MVIVLPTRDAALPSEHRDEPAEEHDLYAVPGE
jgi:hypothetical protein